MSLIIENGVLTKYTDSPAEHNTDVILPDEVKEIGDRAFCDASMTSVILPKGLVSIGVNAFYRCESLKRISFPDSLKTIKRGAFASCGKLEEIVIPNLESWLGISFENEWSNPLFSGPFSSGKNRRLIVEGEPINELSIPMSATRINEWAFAGCNSIQSLVIPGGVSEIGQGAFRNCDNLIFVSIPKSIAKIETEVFAHSGLKEIDLPEGLEEIEREAFASCDSLERIRIPTTIKRIGWNAFSGCFKLKEVHIQSLSAWTSIDFFGNLNMGFQSNPLGGGVGRLSRSGGKLLIDNEIVASLMIESSVSSIEAACFYGCANFVELTIPEGITSIGRCAFFLCPNLEKVILPSTMQTISEFSFSDCPKLISINIPEGVKTVAASAFKGCKSLEEVSLPSTIIEVEKNAFFECRKLKTINIPKSIKTIGKTAFCKSGITKVKILDGLERIEEGAFSQCEQLEEVEISATVSSIETTAFAQCPALKKVTIACRLDSISKDAFSKCSSINEVYILEDQFEEARDYFLKKVKFFTLDGLKLGKPEVKAERTPRRSAMIKKPNQPATRVSTGEISMEAKVVYQDGTVVSPVSDAIQYSKAGPKGFIKPAVKEATVLMGGIEFDAVFKIASKLSSIWKKYYTEKDNGGIYDPHTALEAAQQSGGYIDDSTGSYVSCPLYGKIPDTTKSLKAEEIEARLKSFVIIANQCVEEETLLQIVSALPKKKNGKLYKGRIVHIAYLDLVDYDGSTFEIVAKNEDESQFCVEIRSKVPVVSDLFYQSYLL